MTTFNIIFPSDSVRVDADDEMGAYTKLARFFGKMADGARGDDPDVSGLALSGLNVTIKEN